MSGSSQQFCIRWNSHLGSLGAAFPQMLAGQRFVDVTLACEGHQVHCHRLVLAACSSYFEALLGENPCKHPIIILPRDIKLWEIQALVDFMYKGEVNVSQAGLGDLIKCAEMLQIRGLCGADAALNLNTIATEHKDNAKRNDAKDPDGNDAPKTQTTASTNDSIQMKIDPDSRENTPETTRLTTDSDLPQTQDVTVNKNKSDNHQSAEAPSCGTIRVISNENLFENYNQLVNVVEEEDEGEGGGGDGGGSCCRNDDHDDDDDNGGSLMTKLEIDDDDNSDDIMMQHLIPPSLKYDRKSMSISVRSGRASSVESCENIICSPNLDDSNEDGSNTASIAICQPQHQRQRQQQQQNGGDDGDASSSMDDDMDLPPLIPFTKNQIKDEQLIVPPPKAFVLRNPRGNQPRSYNIDALWAALMNVKAGESIYRASQIHKVPRKTLRNWMKRWDIKSSFPMPRQLRQAAEKKRLSKMDGL
ncbi:broad-complex core protein isoforms 1/2/3/4/5 isoform X1 [Phlebotomus papatasi]|uniref:broad-complex core protein isoforms 1/2/3/4/5 isoform X1 n=1 Tax=Phlebotomus papatasi TaxID=29031 RepID=UPI002483A285|nr:broad-complex core protein isoforms 1/2/3/4/5 isoform X1 [Phlebotomus papatasi]